MNNTKINLCQPRSFGELFIVTFAFIKQNYRLYFKTLLIYAFPLALLAELFISLSNFFLSDQHFNFLQLSDPNLSLVSNLENTAYFVLSFIAYVIVMSITFRFIKMYNANETMNHFNSFDIWFESKRNLGWMTGYSMFIVLLFIVMFTIMAILCVIVLALVNRFVLLLLIPLFSVIFIYFYVGTAFTFLQKMEAEDLKLFDTLRKSIQLIGKNWWKSFGFIIVLTIISFVILYLIIEFINTFIIPYVIAVSIRDLNLFEADRIISLFIAISTAILNSIYFLISTSFYYVGIGALFYSLYENSKGNHLKQQIESISTGLNNDTVEQL